MSSPVSSPVTSPVSSLALQSDHLPISTSDSSSISLLASLLGSSSILSPVPFSNLDHFNVFVDRLVFGFITGFSTGLVVDFIAGLTVDLVDGLFASLAAGLTTDPVDGLASGLVAALVAGLVACLTAGLEAGLIAKLAFSLITSLIASLVVCPTIAFVDNFTDSLNDISPKSTTTLFPPLGPLQSAEADRVPASMKTASAAQPPQSAVNTVVINHKLNCLLLNARSLNNKLASFRYLIYSENFDIIMVTESWLASSTTNGLLDPDNRFFIFRYDRPLRKGGGVCIFVKRTLEVINIEIVKNDNNAHIETEIVCVDIIINKGKYRLITVYRPPGCTMDFIHYNTVLIADLEILFEVNYPVVLSGDLNCADVNWINNTSPKDGVQDILLDFFISRGCEQFVRAPTRLNNILDVVLTDSPNLIDSLEVINPLGNSDHCMVRFLMCRLNVKSRADQVRTVCGIYGVMRTIRV